MSQLSLLDLGPTPARRRFRTADWLDRLRAAIRMEYRGCTITTDEVWALMDRKPYLRLPEGVHPNALGRLFSAWDCATKTGGYARSTRPGANGNLLTQWVIR